MATVRVVLEAIGGRRVMQALQGLRRATRAAARDNRTEGAKATRQTGNDARVQAAGAKAVSDAERTKRRELRATERERDHGERAERRRQREASRRARADAGRGRRPRGGGDGFGSGAAGALGIPMSGAALGGAAVGGIALALGRMVESLERVTSALEAQGGVQDTGARTATAADFETGLVSLGGEVFGDMSPQERADQLGQLATQINEVALATNQSPGDLLQALQGMQTEFSAFDMGRENLEALAREATRLQMPVQDLARYVGLVNQQFGEMDANRILDITAQAGLRGALDPQSLSQDFSGQIGTYSTFLDPNQALTPEERLRSFVASANVLRQSGLDSNRSATLMDNTFSALLNEQNQRRIRTNTGVDIRRFRNEQGALDMPGYLEALEGSGRFNDLTSIGRSIHDMQGRQALNTFMASRRRAREGTGIDMRGLQGADAEAGARFRETHFNEMMGTRAARMRGLGVETEVEGWDSFGQRFDRAATAAVMGENLTAQGLGGEMLNVAPVRHLGAAVVGTEGGREVARQGRGVTMDSMGGGGWFAILNPLFRAMSSTADEVEEAEAIANPQARPIETRPTNIADPSIDRLAMRIGEEVRRGQEPGAGRRNEGSPDR